jgi:NAD(P)-dependent dehydrogenase (short-subunit alcohol dehydrogenase family)
MGRCYCERFAEEGAKVAVIYHSQIKAAEDVVQSIAAKGGTAKAYQCDVTDPGQIEVTFATIAEGFGGIDVLVNNAGIYLLTPIGDTSEEVWDRQINTGLKGIFFCTQSAVPYMKKRGGGKIINIGSIAGDHGMPGSSAYCAVKGATKMLTKTMCLELREYNIQVNNLSPGCIETDMNKDYREENGDFMKSLQERFGTGNPWLSPEEMAGTALFLASSDSDAVTGANIMVDRGYAAY